MDIGARADDEQYDQEEGLEVEKSRLDQTLSVTYITTSLAYLEGSFVPTYHCALLSLRASREGD